MSAAALEAAVAAPVLSARGLDLTATIGGRPVTVLRDLSFDLAPGRVLGVIGESGAGKSMIGRLVSQLLPPRFRVTAGRLDFDGLDLVRLAPRARRALLGRRIAFIPQEPISALDPVLSIGAQFDEHLRRLGLRGRDARRARALAALADVELPDPPALLQRFAHQLSGGQCQRVLIAMAFAADPPLVIADEPTTALDVGTQARISGLMRRMQRDHGTALLFITHDLRLAAHVCDDLMVLYAGEMVEAGPARAVFADPRHPYTRSLQRANPSLSGPRVRLATLPDHMPGLARIAELPGCRFAPRCPVADPACAAAPPPLAALGGGRSVRCTPVCRAGVEATAGVALAPAPAAEGVPILRVRGLAKRYRARGRWFGRRTPVDAVVDLSLDLHAGEFVGIVGESGSGKSTVAKLLVGLVEPSAGTIEVDGRPLRPGDPDVRALRIQTLQMVFQDPQSALNPRRVVASLVTQAMEAGRRRAGWPDRLARARELLALTGLPPDAATRFPVQLSGGQRQRVNIARALCSEPRVLIADEIVSGLDVSVQAQVLNLLLALREQGRIAVLLISHDLSVVRYLCSRVLVMNRGRVVESGPTEAVFSAPTHPYTRALLAAVPPDDPDAAWPPERPAAFD